MDRAPPARPGDPIADIDTPALVLDMEAFEANLAWMAAEATRLGIALRPHAKSHKCAEIARRQIAAGAIGVCVQKVSEAAALAAEGIGDILVCNELVRPAKIAELIRIGRTARVTACVDDADNVALIARMAAEAGVVVPLMVEVDVGHGRCGVAPGQPAVDLAWAINASPHLRFAGLQAYHGSAQHIRDTSARRAAAEAAIARADATRTALASAGIVCPVITGGGTGTFRHEGASAVFTEIQPGSYVFMDADYLRNQWDEPPFRQSLFVLAGVMSRAAAGQVVVDAGLKALSVDCGMPLVAGHEGLSYIKASDEHGTILVPDGARAPALGESLRLVPGHCDPTVNLHDWLVTTRGGRVEALWPVTARGCLA